MKLFFFQNLKTKFKEKVLIFPNHDFGYPPIIERLWYLEDSVSVFKMEKKNGY